ncbi:conserved hypothetical protein [Kribbella flavida DSM 17836]|uniref:Putative zinc-finger domain-containing protein n=1 Tax=Kribbella flavida (strain DSM 17836 / JCM 10339 / NBRC 14399) TaxID=479435 RepID=D2PKW2_KRIFD|nr:zf-HC2 domain-containing protein [Kribbella flavida]ADB32429.1 conserved hypothetical protein [Kribbella flavida DSM 17836]
MNDLDCRRFVELVTAFLESALAPEQEQEFVDHLARCDGCDRYLDQIRQTTQALDGLPGEALSPEIRATLLDAFRHRPR